MCALILPDSCGEKEQQRLRVAHDTKAVSSVEAGSSHIQTPESARRSSMFLEKKLRFKHPEWT